MECFGNTFRGKRVLVTGHTGFKGSWLATWLLKLGAKVVGYSKDVPTQPSMFEQTGLSASMETVVGDIADMALLEETLERVRPDFVFHLAAQAIVSRSYSDPLETIQTNVVGTGNILQALRRITWPCAAVMITSDKCYENVEWPWGYRENDRLGGKDIYSASKGGAELMFHAFWHSFFSKAGTPLTLATARAGNVIGGGDWAKDRIVADCVRAWMAGGRVRIRSPRSTRPWQHVLEPLSGYLHLARELSNRGALNGESFNFGPKAEQAQTVADLLNALAGHWSPDWPEEPFVVDDVAKFHEAGLLKLNCDKALHHLAWEPNLAYAEAIAMTGSWYREVLKEGRDACDVTGEQIDEFTRLARDRGRVWAT